MFDYTIFDNIAQKIKLDKLIIYLTNNITILRIDFKGSINEGYFHIRLTRFWLYAFAILVIWLFI